MRDERYLHFEGAGVISKWALELLGRPHQFDHDTIADVVLTFRYTARPGASQILGASSAVKAWLKGNSARLFSMRHEFPSAWAQLKKAPLTPGQKVSLSFELKDEHYPYRLQSIFSNARNFHFSGRTKASPVEVELLRSAVSIGKTTLVEGEGTITPAPQGGAPGSFDPRGQFELRFDTTSFEDIWIVMDWAAETA